MIEPLAIEASCAARVPKEGLTSLASLRRLAGVRIVELSDFAWIEWGGALPSLVRALLPAVNVQFYTRHDLDWRPIGASMPDFAVPFSGEKLALDRAILPSPVAPAPPPDGPSRRVMVMLTPSEQARPATAMRFGADALGRWVEQATTWEIGRLQGAVCGDVVWLCGEPLPPIAGAERFWGERVLAPLGFRTEPDWPEGSLCEAAGVDDDEILVLTQAGPETLPVKAFQPLTRAGVRLMARSLLG